MTAFKRILDGLRDAARKVSNSSTGSAHTRKDSDLEQLLTKQLEEMAGEVPRMSLGIAKIRNIVGKLESEIADNRAKAAVLKKRIEEAITGGDDSSAESGVTELAALAERTKRARAKLEQMNALYDEAIHLKELNIVEIEEKTRDFEWIIRPVNLERFRRLVSSALADYESYLRKEQKLDRDAAALKPKPPAVEQEPSGVKPVGKSPATKSAYRDTKIDESEFELDIPKPKHTANNPDLPKPSTRLSNPSASDGLKPDRFDWYDEVFKESLPERVDSTDEQ